MAQLLCSEGKSMEVYLYNSTVCRLCGEENDNGTLLYSCEENTQNLSEIINSYLPIKVSDDGQLPRTICPGCTIQLEATVEFLNLIINGQKIIRELHMREIEYKKTLLNCAVEQEIITENIVYEVNTSDGVYQVEHPIALQVAGLEKPKRKRGRPPKKPKSPEELAIEAAAREQVTKSVKKDGRYDEPTGKRRRKTPTRFREAVQGKELERIFKEEGVIDPEEIDMDSKSETPDPKVPHPKEPEIIGHLEDSGELVVIVKGKGRGRPKGRMRQTREECSICGMEFSCVGRYMSHVAQHGPVSYQCGQCLLTFPTRLTFTTHQQDLGHTGQNVIPCPGTLTLDTTEEKKHEVLSETQGESSKEVAVDNSDKIVITSIPNGLPDLNPQPVDVDVEVNVDLLKTPDQSESTPNAPISREEDIAPSPVTIYVKSEDITTNDVEPKTEPKSDEVVEEPPTGKVKLKCNHCDKLFSSKQSKSMHIKAAHLGERPYTCGECGARFAYPRSLALHAVSHRRHRHAPAQGYACDLCGKVLNHPSSVVYHKEAEHAGQRYVCNKCGKSFKHKQLLQRHQLVHSQLRPFSCKICNASFKTKANLINHQLLHSGVKKFSCEICKHKFAHKTSLTLHMRWHTGQKPYTCNVCGKSFSQKGNLSEHARIHSGEKPYQCSLCGRRFTTSSQHRLHATRHTQHRPYACTHCGKRFVSRASWAAHQRREAAGGAGAGGAGAGGAGGAAGAGGAGGARSHRCAQCPRAFTERWALRKHARTHTGERPFRCPHCPRTFADCSNLNKHKKQVHKQISLLANQQQVLQQHLLQVPQQLQVPAKYSLVATDEELEERVIYVTYEDSNSPAFHILDADQAEEEEKITDCEVYPEGTLVVPPLALEQSRPLLFQDESEGDHMPVTDEQGNPLHFTMQDGTRLAITSADGQSLQVITQDGQTIPVEINGFEDEEEVDNPDTIVHHLDLQKTVEENEPVTHYFTLV